MNFFISSTLTFFPLFQVDLLQLRSRGIDYFISVFICVLYQILNKILGKNQIEKIIGSASAGTPTFIPGVSVNGKFLIVGGSLLQLWSLSLKATPSLPSSVAWGCDWSSKAVEAIRLPWSSRVLKHLPLNEPPRTWTLPPICNPLVRGWPLCC